MSSYYTQLTIKTKPQFVELLGDFVVSVINEAIEYTQESIIIRTENDTKNIKEAIESIVGSSIPIEFVEEQKENQDWIAKYKESINPIDAGEFYIHPQWYPPKDGKINIVINPALAFGSGHHATTYSCLGAVSRYVKDGMSMLDVGCGSGILALAGAKKGAKVDMCDTDPLAVDSAKENFELNNQKYNQSWIGSVNGTDKEYDIVVANIIADVLRAISKSLKDRLKDDGVLILSGILDKKESIVTDSFRDLKPVDRISKDEWITLVYKKDSNGTTTG